VRRFTLELWLATDLGHLQYSSEGFLVAESAWHLGGFAVAFTQFNDIIEFFLLSISAKLKTPVGWTNWRKLDPAGICGHGAETCMLFFASSLVFPV
jgi:hypothetical protein